MDSADKLHSTQRERKSLDHDILEKLDHLAVSAQDQNQVLLRLMSALGLTGFKSSQSNETSENMHLGASIIDLQQKISFSDIAIAKKKKQEKPDYSKTSSRTKFDSLEELIVNESSEKVLELIKKHVDIIDEATHIASTTTVFNINKLPETKLKSIVNLKRINDIRRINKFFEAVNARLPLGGKFVSSVETYSNRKARILKKSFYPLNWVHYTIDVFFKRVVPKIPVLKKFYFIITRGHNRVLSKAETFGRLYSCGFEIVHEQFVNDRLYFVVKKTGKPAFDMTPTYGPLIRLKRHGKDGKLFNVYKLRTMHAYSEYLQDYVFRMNDLQQGGKFANDFRITTEGKLFRKFWLDELPMFINLLKRQMKLVGVRPLSSQYYNLYTEELKAMRIQHKPGLIPPFYADMPETLEEIMASEMRYLKQYEKEPLVTDIKYLFKAFYNIFFRKARSK
jgi:lipopolysaccharide/colanic/teichoic acid biosynthesis glycosyltransferase